jgi:hypothetical protein
MCIAGPQCALQVPNVRVREQVLYRGHADLPVFVGYLVDGVSQISVDASGSVSGWLPALWLAGWLAGQGV